jgi:hypothetical protein
MVVALPEDLRHLAWIAESDRPLVVCDIDEVTLAFVSPFMAFLTTRGYELQPRSFRLTGNILDLRTGAAADRATVSDLIESFFLEQARWQRPVDRVQPSLAALSEIADVIFLTAMAPRHFQTRRELLDSHDLPYPMIATEDAKGTILKLVHGDRQTKVAFVDDIAANLYSVRETLPNAFLVNLMANDAFRALAPDPGAAIARPATWPDAQREIGTFLND